MRHHRFLAYVDEVARAGSIRKAAERLNVTASALNRRLLDIEVELGEPLFERHARGMRPTAAGEAFIRYVRQQASGLARLRSEIEDIRGYRRGEVKLAVSQTVAQDLLPRAISAFRESYPLVEFDVHVCDRFVAMQRLIDYDADLVLVINPESAEECEALASAPQHVYAFMAAGHPLAGRTPLRMADIVEYPLALPEPGLGSRILLEAYFARTGIPRRVILQTNSFELLKTFVRSSQAIAFQIQVGAPDSRRGDGLVAQPIAEQRLATANLVLGQLRGRKLPVAAARFAQEVAGLLDAMS